MQPGAKRGGTTGSRLVLSERTSFFVSQKGSAEAMRVSQQFTTTTREVQGGQQDLLVRAGYIRQLTAGVYSLLPMGQRVLQNIAQIIREELDAVGGQQISLPLLQPRSIWEQRQPTGSTRAEILGDLLFTVDDRRGRALALAPMHEEVVTMLASEFVRSYRDLPRLVYQIQPRMRDELRPRGGLLRLREFTMADLYSFDADQVGLDASYMAMAQAYRRIFERLGLHYLEVEADSGAIGGKQSHEFLALMATGDDTAMVCQQCGYAANREKAEFARGAQSHEPPDLLEEVSTPGCASISELVSFLHVPAEKILKTVCYAAEGQLVLALVRGDLQINEVKLTNAVARAGINTANLHLATAQELQDAGIVAGFTSPVGQPESVRILADLALQMGRNDVAGANRMAYHLTHVNYPRDFRVGHWENLASADERAGCARCGGLLRSHRGSEIGHIFQVGDLYSELFHATYLAADGTSRPLLLGCYGIGLERLMGPLWLPRTTTTGSCAGL